MALTYAEPTVRVSIGGRWLTVTQVTLDNAYPTGGYTLNPEKLGLTDGLLDLVLPSRSQPSGGASSYGCGATGSKLQLYATGAANNAIEPEVQNNIDLHLHTVTVMAIGR